MDCETDEKIKKLVKQLHQQIDEILEYPQTYELDKASAIHASVTMRCILSAIDYYYGWQDGNHYSHTHN